MPESTTLRHWLLDPAGSDPSIRWQAMRDLLELPKTEWTSERARVETEGWGARLLAFEDDDGQWAGGAYIPADYDWDGPEPGQPWTATSHTLTLLRELGLEPTSERVRRAVESIAQHAYWEHAGQPYWEGEVEPCVNGQAVANGAYFGRDMGALVARLMAEQLEDGGWNCEAERGSVRSSFDTTINVLEGLLEFERTTGGTVGSRAARRSGEEYLLRRSLFRRLSTGEPVDDGYLQLAYPTRWHYDVLRALDHFRAASRLTDTQPDHRLSEAIEYLRGRRLDDGRWQLDRYYAGRTWFELEDGPGRPSRWITLRALRVLRWWDRPAAATPSSTGPRAHSG